MVVMNVLDVKLGFTFSAGLFDYLLSYGLGKNGLYLIPVGVVYALVYYILFKWTILKFNLQTPGREEEPSQENQGATSSAATEPQTATVAETQEPADNSRGAQYLRGLGGKDNIKTIDACATRLRVEVVNADAVDTPALKAIGARGVVKSAGGAVQVIIGPEAELISDEVKKYLH